MFLPEMQLIRLPLHITPGLALARVMRFPDAHDVLRSGDVRMVKFKVRFDGVSSESILSGQTTGDGTVMVAFVDPIVMINVLIRDAVSLNNFVCHFVGKLFLFVPGRAVKYSLNKNRNN